jgi:hypothetical protein
MGAGAGVVILALAGVHSPVRTGLVLVFLAVAPTGAIAGLLGSFDPFARLILAVVSTIVVLSIVAVILLSAGLWSPIGELLVVAAITVACLAAQRPSVRARVAAWARPGWQALLRHIPGVRSAGAAAAAAEAAGTTGAAAEAVGTAGAPAQVHGNGHVKLLPAEAAAQGTGTGQADADTAELPRNGQAELDTAELDAAELAGAERGGAEMDGAETTAEAETAGPTEVTTPLPAIRD